MTPTQKKLVNLYLVAPTFTAQNALLIYTAELAGEMLAEINCPNLEWQRVAWNPGLGPLS